MSIYVAADMNLELILADPTGISHIFRHVYNYRPLFESLDV